MLELVQEPLALRVDDSGVIRVGQTRVTLDIVVEAFNEGATAEEIVYQYPTLNLADVYSVIGYYLHRRAEVDAYLAERRERAAQVQRENEARHSSVGIRERLLARRKIDEDFDPDWYIHWQESSCREKLAALGMETRRYLTTLEGYTELLSKHFRGETPKPITEENLIWGIDRMQVSVIELRRLCEIMQTDFGKSE